MAVTSQPASRKLAINRLRDRRPLLPVMIDRFLARHEVPVVEGARCTFLYRGEADEVFLVHRIFGLPDHLPLRRLRGTDLWHATLELPDGSRMELFGSGGGAAVAESLSKSMGADVPLLGKVPLSEPLREHADDGTPLVTAEPDSPASQMIRQAARGIIAATPQELPVLQAVPAAAEPPPVSGIPLPVVQSGA